MNRLAEATAYYKVYDANSNEYYGITSLELPQLTKTSIDIKGSGILGTISAPIEFALDSMTATLNFRVVENNMISFLAPGKKSFVLVLLTQETDVSTLAPAYRGWRILLEGKSKSAQLGSVESGESSNSSCELEVYHLKVLENGQEVIDINKLGGVYKIGGVDYMQAINAGLESGTNVDLSLISQTTNEVLSQLQTGSNGTSLQLIVNSVI